MIVEAEHFVPGSEPGVAPAPAAFLRPDAALLFPRRAARLRVLAEGHEMGAYLRFIADLVDLQTKAAGLAGDWTELLPVILAGIGTEGVPAPVAEAVKALSAETAQIWAARAERLRLGEPEADDFRYAPFLTAAIQAELTRDAASAEAEMSEPGLCPLCGAHPVASTLGTEGQVAGLRRLHCGWCGTAWHLPRLCCSGCGAEGKLSYYRLEGGEIAVKAEACGHCGLTLKQFDLEISPQVEPLADDLACMALDQLVADRGGGRLGRVPNPFLPGG